MSKKKKTCILLLVIAVVLIAALAITAVFVIKNLDKNLESLSNFEITDVNLEEIADGTYNGKYKSLPIIVEVNVTVKNHKITKIDIIKHQNGKGEDAEAIIDNVIEEQSLEVDAITGATYSSKVILLAIQDALKKAQSV